MIGFYLTKINKKLKTFYCIVPEYYEEERERLVNVLKKLNTDHSFVEVTNSLYANTIKEVIWLLDAPINGKVQPLQKILGHLATSKGVYQLWSGNTADGLFFDGIHDNGLVPSFKDEPIYKQMALQYVSASLEEVKDMLLNPDDLEQCLKDRFNLARTILSLNLDSRDAETIYNFAIVGPRLAISEETMIASTGATVILPYISPIMLKTLSQIPFKMLNYGGEKKFLLKKIYEEIYGKVAWEKKIGFGAPNRSWLKDKEGIGKFVDLIQDDCMLSNYLDIKTVKETIQYRLNDSSAPLDYMIWPLVNLEVFLNLYKDGIWNIKERINE